MSVPEAPPLMGPVSGMSPPPPSGSSSPGAVESKATESKALVKVPENSGNALPGSSGEPGLSNIQPIPIKKTLMIVNNFVINTAEFINKFAALSERKLNNISQSIQRLEIVLSILEAKLASIEWLASAPGSGAPAANSNVANPAANNNGGSSIPAPPVEGAPSNSNSNGSGAGGGTDQKHDGPAANPTPSAKPAVPTIPVQEDPRYKNYFKMLKLGVPKVQLKMKMESEGVDPNVIDLDPEAPAPPAEDGDPGSNGNGNNNNSNALVKVDTAGSGSDTD